MELYCKRDCSLSVLAQNYAPLFPVQHLLRWNSALFTFFPVSLFTFFKNSFILLLKPKLAFYQGSLNENMSLGRGEGKK